jgi:hypothetical protein
MVLESEALDLTYRDFLLLEALQKAYLFVISARASASPCFPPALQAPIALFLPLHDLPSRLDPSTFPLRTRYKLPIWDDLFNLVVAFLGRKDFAPTSGGGGGNAAPFASGMGNGDGTDPFRGIKGGGGGGATPLDGIMGGGGGGATPLEGIMGGGGGGAAFIVCDAMGGSGGGGGGGGYSLVGTAFDGSSGLSLVSWLAVVNPKSLFSSTRVIGSSTFLFTLKALESQPPTLDNVLSERRFASTWFSFPTARTLRDQRIGGL